MACLRCRILSTPCVMPRRLDLRQRYRSGALSSPGRDIRSSTCALSGSLGCHRAVVFAGLAGVE